MGSPERRPPVHPILSSPGDPYLDYGPPLPDRHGIGFEAQNALYAIMRELAG